MFEFFRNPRLTAWLSSMQEAAQGFFGIKPSSGSVPEFYLMRVVNNHTHFTQEKFNLAKVTQELTDRRGGFTSVYRVADVPSAERIAALFSMMGRDKPATFEYVLIPQAWLVQCNIKPVPAFDDKLPHPLLRETHYELHGLNPESCERLAEKFRASDGAIARRIQSRELIRLVEAEIASDETGETAALIEGKEGWKNARAKAAQSSLHKED